jgi:hypothetical protein
MVAPGCGSLTKTGLEISRFALGQVRANYQVLKVWVKHPYYSHCTHKR